MDRVTQDLAMYEWEQSRRAKGKPICCECCEPIFDDYLYDVENQLYCYDCVKDNKTTETECWNCVEDDEDYEHYILADHIICEECLEEFKRRAEYYED